MDDATRYRRGMEVRRAVLGDAHVDRATAGQNDFNRDLQELITRYAWGEIWSRPGLSRQVRSLATVAMLVALNRPEELRLHLAGAVRNGVGREELKELLLHAAVYCGVPAAHAAFRVAEEVLRALEAEAQGPKDSPGG